MPLPAPRPAAELLGSALMDAPAALDLTAADLIATSAIERCGETSPFAAGKEARARGRLLEPG